MPGFRDESLVSTLCAGRIRNEHVLRGHQRHAQIRPPFPVRTHPQWRAFGFERDLRGVFRGQHYKTDVSLKSDFKRILRQTCWGQRWLTMEIDRNQLSPSSTFLGKGMCYGRLSPNIHS